LNEGPPTCLLRLHSRCHTERWPHVDRDRDKQDYRYRDSGLALAHLGVRISHEDVDTSHIELDSARWKERVLRISMDVACVGHVDRGRYLRLTRMKQLPIVAFAIAATAFGGGLYRVMRIP
jgi:hypothetical protein